MTSGQLGPKYQGGDFIGLCAVPNDLSRIKTKLAFNLTKRQLICFSIAGGIGIPFYLFTRSHIGNSMALFLMIG